MPNPSRVRKSVRGGSTVMRARENRGQTKLNLPLPPGTSATRPKAHEVELMIGEADIRSPSTQIAVLEIVTVARHLLGITVTVSRIPGYRNPPSIKIGREEWAGFDDIRRHLIGMMANRIKHKILNSLR